MDIFGTNIKGKFIIKSLPTLPAWTSIDEGRIVYITADHKYYYGTNVAWVEGGGGGAIERVSTLPIWQASDEGRIIYTNDSHKYYYGTNVAWVEGGGSISGTDPINIDTSAVDGIDNNSLVRVRNSLSQLLSVTWHSSQTTPEQTPNTHGRFSSGKVYNAVYNDIVDFFPVGSHLNNIEMGKVYILNKDGSVKLSEVYGQKGILGITSDTYGFGVGSKGGLSEINGIFSGSELPISIGGFVLAHIDSTVVNNLEPGDFLTCGVNGVLTKILTGDTTTFIVAYYLKPELNSIWNEVKVNNRHWVKVR